MSTLTIPTAQVFEPLIAPARDKVARGGRGSGKSHYFAGALVEDSLAEPGENGGEGLRSVCIREVQKDLAQSAMALVKAKISEFRLGPADGFKVYKEVIETPGDGIIIFEGMNDHNADSIKSLEGFKRAWWEEAHSATQHSIDLLRPTIRTPGSQMWWSYNPRRRNDPVDMLFMGREKPTGAVVVNANWRDNPWFTAELEQERQDCLRIKPDGYDHIWEGDYVQVIDGAYFSKHLKAAKRQGRIGKVSPEPMMTLRTYHDLAGSSDKADAYAIWVVQFIGREIRVLAYYETVGQSPEFHINWVRDWCLDHGFSRCQINLPHDGANVQIDNRWRDYWDRASGDEVKFDTVVHTGQTKGIAMQRVEAVREQFHRIWFDEQGTTPGREALGWYHEKIDKKRNVGLGPDHDWSSHGADAFGLMCMDYAEPQVVDARRPRRRSGEGTWMGTA